MSSSKFLVLTEPEKCSGCRRCQLICSFQFTEEFNLNDARIKIVENDQGVSNITFTEDCNMCGVCVSYCAYDALKLERKR